ncbi:GMC family oxidoreductase [Sorangium sp. So ce291]|uniref:GMC oxidoreductase n=1 Tax=Sorangium sp. So ce291 TaxID=3133294 RepID=UPI003F5D7D5F
MVGSGATGGWAAKELGESGLDVLVLDAGRKPHLSTYIKDRRAYQATLKRKLERQPVQSKHGGYRTAPSFFVDDRENPYTTPNDKPFYWIRGRQVGGRSLTWGGVALRLSDYEFKAASRDGFGIDWPISHADLDAYYGKVERFHGVRGRRDRLPQLPDGCFNPPPRLSEGELLFKDAVTRRWRDRAVINSRAIPGAPLPHDGVLTKWPAFSSVGSTLAAALRTGRTTVRPDAIACHILVDGDTGKAKGVRFIDRKTHRVHEAFGRVIVLCASTIETTRLMLNSADRLHPNGLGNSSGLLGKCLMDHPTVRLFGTVPHRRRGKRQSKFGGPNAIYIPRFRNINQRENDFIRGYGIWGAVDRDLDFLRLGADVVPFAFWASLEMLANSKNQVTLDKGVNDAWGIPVARIECSYSDNELKMIQDAQDSLREMAEQAGFEPALDRTGSTPPGLWVHEVGTAPMGTDPRTSVLNPFNQCWDVRNLFVTDGACWVSGGCQNPTLTMMAITARACDVIVRQLKRGEL